MIWILTTFTGFLVGLFIGFILMNKFSSKYNLTDTILFFILKQKIKRMFSKMSYSVERNFLDATDSIVLDFKTNNIIFNNFYKQKNRKNDSGVCGDLAYIIYISISDFFKNYYDINVVVGSESNYFYKDGASEISHIFLTLKRSDNSLFVIDPTFKRIMLYDKYSYDIGMIVPPKTILSDKDLMFEINPNKLNQLYPIKILGDSLLLIGIKIIDSKNYSFTLMSKKRYVRKFNDLAVYVCKDGNLNAKFNINIVNFKGKDLKSIKKLISALEIKLKDLIKNIEIIE